MSAAGAQVHPLVGPEGTLRTEQAFCPVDVLTERVQEGSIPTRQGRQYGIP